VQKITLGEKKKKRKNGKSVGFLPIPYFKYYMKTNQGEKPAVPD